MEDQDTRKRPVQRPQASALQLSYRSTVGKQTSPLLTGDFTNKMMSAHKMLFAFLFLSTLLLIAVLMGSRSNWLILSHDVSSYATFLRMQRPASPTNRTFGTCKTVESGNPCDPELPSPDDLIRNGTTKDGPSDKPRPAVWYTDYLKMGENIGELLTTRTAMIYKMCDQFNLETIFQSYTKTPGGINSQHKTYGRMLLDRIHNVSVCLIPKIGSTFSASFFDSIRPKSDRLSRKPLPLTEWYGSPMKKFYKSYVIVRNPWTRLVSLYQEKVETFLVNGRPPSPIDDKKIAPYNFLRAVCKAKNISDLVTFADLIRCVVDHYDRREANEHWQAAVESCDVCSRNVDYIVRLENLQNEMSYIFERSGMSDAWMRMAETRNKTMREAEKSKPRLRGDYYRDVPEEFINKLRQMYKYECALFGYPDSPFEM